MPFILELGLGIGAWNCGLELGFGLEELALVAGDRGDALVIHYISVLRYNSYFAIRPS
jgi:hypothetical protein